MQNSETLQKQIAGCVDPKNKRQEWMTPVGFEEVRTGGVKQHQVKTISEERKNISHQQPGRLEPFALHFEVLVWNHDSANKLARLKSSGSRWP